MKMTRWQKMTTRQNASKPASEVCMCVLQRAVRSQCFEESSSFRKKPLKIQQCEESHLNTLQKVSVCLQVLSELVHFVLFNFVLKTSSSCSEVNLNSQFYFNASTSLYSVFYFWLSTLICIWPATSCSCQNPSREEVWSGKLLSKMCVNKID